MACALWWFTAYGTPTQRQATLTLKRGGQATEMAPPTSAFRYLSFLSLGLSEAVSRDSPPTGEAYNQPIYLHREPETYLEAKAYLKAFYDEGIVDSNHPPQPSFEPYLPDMEIYD